MNLEHSPARSGTLHNRLRTPDAARYVGLAPSTLEKLRVIGGGPAYEKVGPRIVVYSIESLEAWLRARRRSSTSDASA
jgi:hypothetical protein